MIVIAKLYFIINWARNHWKIVFDCRYCLFCGNKINVNWKGFNMIKIRSRIGRSQLLSEGPLLSWSDIVFGAVGTETLYFLGLQAPKILKILRLSEEILPFLWNQNFHSAKIHSHAHNNKIDWKILYIIYY